MDPIKLLAQQLQQYQDQNQKNLHQYQDQNQREHEQLTKKIDQVLAEVHALNSERNTEQALNNDKFQKLESGQSEIKKDLKEIKDQNLKRDHLIKWLLQALGAVSIAAGLIATAWKLGWLSWIG